ncbi:MAG: acyltransferase, partial [Candidatus Acidiferrum sp.]
TVELPALTGIRFYAALAVFVSHVSLIPKMEELSAGYKVFDLGRLGVSFFFLLSGFILTFNYTDLFRREVSANKYTQFVWSRFSKIYPVYFVTMLMAIPIQIYSPNKPIDWRAVPIHTFLLQCWLPFSKPVFYNYLNVPSWSISCEWFFYLLAPVAMFCVLGTIRRRAVLLGITATYIAALGLFLWHTQSDSTSAYFLNWFAPTRFVDFLAGVFVARLFMAPRSDRLAALSVPAQIAGFAYLIAIILWGDRLPWPFHSEAIYMPGSALLVFGLAHSRGFFAAHLSHPWLRRLGLASFSFYMLHTPIMRALRGVYYFLGWETRTWTGFWLVTVAAFIVIQAAAFLMLYKFELPVQKWLRSLREQPTARAGIQEILEPSRTSDNVPPPADSPVWQKLA